MLVFTVNDSWKDGTTKHVIKSLLHGHWRVTGISARQSIIALGPKGPQAIMDLLGRYACKRASGHVIISKYCMGVFA